MWLLDSNPVECAGSRETVKRSNLAGAAGYGYCACIPGSSEGSDSISSPPRPGSRSRSRSPTRNTTSASSARDLLETDPSLLRAGQTVLADKGYRSAEFDAFLTDRGLHLIRPTFGNDPPRPGQRYLKPLRQIIESINQTLKAQLDLERHAARTFAGLTARVLQRLLALTTAIWHNGHTGHRPLRALTTYDH